MRNPALVQALVGQASEKMQAWLGEIFSDGTDADNDGKPDPVELSVVAYSWERAVVRTAMRTVTEIDEATGEEYQRFHW